MASSLHVVKFAMGWGRPPRIFHVRLNDLDGEGAKLFGVPVKSSQRLSPSFGRCSSRSGRRPHLKQGKGSEKGNAKDPGVGTLSLTGKGLFSLET